MCEALKVGAVFYLAILKLKYSSWCKQKAGASICDQMQVHHILDELRVFVVRVAAPAAPTNHGEAAIVVQEAGMLLFRP